MDTHDTCIAPRKHNVENGVLVHIIGFWSVGFFEGQFMSNLFERKHTYLEHQHSLKSDFEKHTDLHRSVFFFEKFTIRFLCLDTNFRLTQ